MIGAGARSSIRVAIPGDAGQYGMLVFYSTIVRDYSQSEVDLLESVAHLLAAAIYRRRADREISAQRQELAALVNCVPDLISRYDTDLTILFVNENCRRGGWDPSQLIGHRVTDLGLPPEVERAWADGIRSVFRTGEPCELVTMSSNGEHVMEVRLVPEADADGKVAHVLSISRDVTARQQAKEERGRLQQQLDETRRIASTSRLGTTVAHEFNNVLMSIAPFAEIIARTDKDNERLQKAAAHIRNAIARGRRVTQDIMRYTRPAAPARRTIDLATWLPAIVQSTIHDPSVEVTVSVPEAPLYADADPKQLEQVVANLLLNAREALAGSCGNNIDVRLANSDDAIRLTIRDNGSGVAPENLDKLFEPFFTTKRTGTGLGLPVVQQIVERHHGTIEVESQKNAGATFIVTLPPAAAPPANRDAEVGQTIRGRQVLLVEDEVAVADGMVALLHEGSAEVRVAATGHSAVVALEQQLPEAVLLDVGLPDIDGIELFSLVRQRWPRLPIIFSTGHGDQARLNEMLRQPHVGHLVKPFDLDELTVAVANAIAG
jgi:PAS domain S-box-containing protein